MALGASLPVGLIHMLKKIVSACRFAEQAAKTDSIAESQFAVLIQPDHCHARRRLNAANSLFVPAKLVILERLLWFRRPL